MTKVSKVLRWPKSLFGFFRNILWKNPNKLFGQPNITNLIHDQNHKIYSDYYFNFPSFIINASSSQEYLILFSLVVFSCLDIAYSKLLELAYHALKVSFFPGNLQVKHGINTPRGRVVSYASFSFSIYYRSCHTLRTPFTFVKLNWLTFYLEWLIFE